MFFTGLMLPSGDNYSFSGSPVPAAPAVSSDSAGGTDISAVIVEERHLTDADFRTPHASASEAEALPAAELAAAPPVA